MAPDPNLRKPNFKYAIKIESSPFWKFGAFLLWNRTLLCMRLPMRDVLPKHHPILILPLPSCPLVLAGTLPEFAIEVEYYGLQNGVRINAILCIRKVKPVPLSL